MRKIFLFAFLFAACGFMEEYADMKEPEVADCTYSEDCIQIVFSKDMEKGLTEQAFSCLCNQELAFGTFVWQGKKMCFYPQGGIREKSRYNVEISTRAEDRNGNSLKEVFSYIFATIEKEEKFFVQKMNISEGDIVSGLMQPIEITFSSSVDQGSFYRGFEISPRIHGSSSFKDNGKIAVFTPLERLDWNSTYTVTLGKSMTDQYGNQLKADFVVKFATPREPQGKLEKVCLGDGTELISGPAVNRGIEKDVSLVLTYSGAADSKTIRTPVSISPAQDFTAQWNSDYTQCTITFKKNLPYKTLLEVSVEKDKRYLLYVDGESSRPLEVQEVKFYRDYTSATEEVLEYGCGIVFETGEAACFEFLLSAGTNAEILAADAYGAVDVAVTRGNLVIELERLETGQIEPGVLFIRVFCSITAGNAQTPVIISASSTLRDSLGNTLEKDYVLRINAL